MRFYETFLNANYQVSISIGSNVMDIWPLTLKNDLDMSYSKCAALKIYMHAKYQVSISTESKVVAKKSNLTVDHAEWPWPYTVTAWNV